jgi:N-alpha-acetyltransferase 15/16, NatA auxiliary subunit
VSLTDTIVVDKLETPLPPKVAEIISSEFNLLPKDVPLSKVNDDYINKHSQSARNIYCGLQVRSTLEPSPSPEKQSAAVLATLSLPTITLHDAQEGMALLRIWESPKVDEFRTECQKKWPESSIFRTSEEGKSAGSA